VATFEELLAKLGREFGVLAESNTHQLTVVAHNSDIAVGDLFLLPSLRGGQQRFYVFRASEYANVLNRSIEIGDVARNKLTMPDSYRSEDLLEEQLIELKGIVLGYAELSGEDWMFRRPRRLPEHLTYVYRVDPANDGAAEVIRILLSSQLGSDGLYIGDLLVGEQALKGVEIRLPVYALSHHLGAFGRTGVGKSNLMMVLLRAVIDYNLKRFRGELQMPSASLLAIDPHDEFQRWHARKGGADGFARVVEKMDTEERAALVEPFYYLTARTTRNKEFERQIFMSVADVVPQDLFSIIEFSEQQMGHANKMFGEAGEEWISWAFSPELRPKKPEAEGSEYLEGTRDAVSRRLGFLSSGHTRVFTPYYPDRGETYRSLLPDIICALEQGRVLIVDTTLMTELEQFLLTTVIARTLFNLRRALCSVEKIEDLQTAIRRAFGNEQDEEGLEIDGRRGQRSLVNALLANLKTGQLPYQRGERPVSVTELAFVNVVVEEAASILNPARMRFGSVFRDISRQGRKFGIGLTVVSQQVSEIDQGVLTQINTELTMGLGNELERREAIRNASADLTGFEKELQVMGKGQVIVTASYRDVPLPVQVPDYDQFAGER
jgi:uncharacterized protein